MKRIQLGLAAVLGTVVAGVIAPGAAVAQTNALTGNAITNFVGPGGGVSIRYDLNVGSYNANDQTTSSGAFTTTIVSYDAPFPGSLPAPVAAGTTVTTYCVDLGITVDANSSRDARISATDGIFDNTPNFSGSNVPNSYVQIERNIGAAGWIVNTYATMALSQLASLFGFSGTESNNDADNDNLLSAREAQGAIQLAVWEAAFDWTSNNLLSGNFKIDRINGATIGNSTQLAANKVGNLAQQMLNARQGRVAVVGFINYEPPGINGFPDNANQDQIFAVPEPANLAAAFSALALLGLGAGLRRRRAMA